MSKSTRIACVLMIVAGLPVVARAQPALTLTQALQDASAFNRSLQAAKTSTREADARISEARSAAFPRVSFVESWQRGDQPVFVFSSLLSSRRFAAANFAIDSLNSPDPTGLFRAAVSFDQVLFDGGRISAAVESASVQREIAGLSAQETGADVALAVTDTFGRVLKARATRLAADAAVAAAEEDLRRATLRRDAGSLSNADVLAVAVHLAGAREQRIQAEGDESVARAELNRLMGSPIDREYDVQEPAAVESAAEPSLPALFAEADRLRPLLKRAAAGLHLADAGVRQARAAWLPQVAAQGGVEANGTRFSDRATSWLVGAEARWTFSTGGSQISQRAAANEAAERARLERDDARAQVQVEIAGARQQLEAARARQAVGQAAVEYARESQRIIRDRFEAGLAGTDDLLRAASATFDAETRRAAALADVLVGRARLDRAVGRTSQQTERPLP